MLHPVLVVSPEWTTRAMLAAQLGETCDRDVVCAPQVSEALALLELARLDPALLVVDAGTQIGLAEIERLAERTGGTRLILVVSALRSAAFRHLRDRCDVYLVRPVTIGEIASAAADVVGQGAVGHSTMLKTVRT